MNPCIIYHVLPNKKLEINYICMYMINLIWTRIMTLITLSYAIPLDFKLTFIYYCAYFSNKTNSVN